MKMSELGGRGRGRCRNKPAESRFVTTGVRVSMTGQHEWHVVGECWDLLAVFMGIRLEKSISCYGT